MANIRNVHIFFLKKAQEYVLKKKKRKKKNHYKGTASGLIAGIPDGESTVL